MTQVPVDHLMFNLTITNIPWHMVLHKLRVQTLMRLAGVNRLFTFMCSCLLNSGSEGFSLGTRGRKHSRPPNASTLRITPVLVWHFTRRTEELVL